MSVAGIQETKWFGKDVWPADGYTSLHPGRLLPSDGEKATRSEGVGVALDERATAAWREAGEVWEAVSSHIVSARLKLARPGQRRPGLGEGNEAGEELLELCAVNLLWKYSCANFDKACDLFDATDWYTIIGNDVNASWSLWQAKFMEVMNVCVPKVRLPEKNTLPWLNSSIYRDITKPSLHACKTVWQGRPHV